MKIILACLWIACISSGLYAQQTIQERLGYSKDSKLLIIHGDDLAVAHSVNEATTKAMETGSVSSGSIMVPCPWLPEIAAYARANTKADLGLHLTLTSEWNYYKWGPIAGKTAVPGLVNDNGYLFASVDSVYRSATLAEVETELRAQVEKARQLGIDVTHFDSHMGALFNNEEYLALYIKLGREYKVPVFIGKEFGPVINKYVNDKDVLIDKVYTANPGDYQKGMAAFYTRTLQSVQPGLSLIIMHVGTNDKELQAVTIDHPDWGAAWRQADNDFFTSEACKKLLKEQNIRLITWREIRDKLYR